LYISKKGNKKIMLIAIGDIHGKFTELKIGIRNILNETHTQNVSIDFVQLGDFGMGFGDPKIAYNELSDLDTDLCLRNSHLWIIRGNHDNPAFWSNTGYRFENIHFVKDDTILTLNEKQCYFAGGAISIDRIVRKQGVNYWDSEHYTNPGELINANVDIIFTHDVYQEISNFKIHTSDIVARWLEKDSRLYQDMLAQQYELKKLYENVSAHNKNIKWYHGHYHESSVFYYDDESFTCGLAELEFKEIR
jgi:hypothetical protein